jgi:hypothetical protein
MKNESKLGPKSADVPLHITKPIETETTTPDLPPFRGVRNSNLRIEFRISAAIRFDS